MELFKVLFILKFLYMKVCTEEAIYDNSALTPATDRNITSCQFVKTEHFVVETTDNSARMHLSTEKLFHTILVHVGKGGCTIFMRDIDSGAWLVLLPEQNKEYKEGDDDVEQEPDLNHLDI